MNVRAGGSRASWWSFPGNERDLVEEVRAGRFPSHLHPAWFGSPKAFDGTLQSLEPPGASSDYHLDLEVEPPEARATLVTPYRTAIWRNRPPPASGGRSSGPRGRPAGELLRWLHTLEPGYSAEGHLVALRLHKRLPPRVMLELLASEELLGLDSLIVELRREIDPDDAGERFVSAGARDALRSLAWSASMSPESLQRMLDGLPSLRHVETPRLAGRLPASVETAAVIGPVTGRPERLRLAPGQFDPPLATSLSWLISGGVWAELGSLALPTIATDREVYSLVATPPSSLAELVLDDSDLEDAGAVVLARAARTWPSLRRVSVRRCRVGLSGFRALYALPLTDGPHVQRPPLVADPELPARDPRSVQVRRDAAEAIAALFHRAGLGLAAETVRGADSAHLPRAIGRAAAEIDRQASHPGVRLALHAFVERFGSPPGSTVRGWTVYDSLHALAIARGMLEAWRDDGPIGVCYDDEVLRSAIRRLG